MTSHEDLLHVCVSFAFSWSCWSGQMQIWPATPLQNKHCIYMMLLQSVDEMKIEIHFSSHQTVLTCISVIVCTINISCKSSLAPSIQLLNGAALLANSRWRRSILSSTSSTFCGWMKHQHHQEKICYHCHMSKATITLFFFCQSSSPIFPHILIP